MRRDGDLRKYKRHLLNSSQESGGESKQKVSPSVETGTAKMLIEVAKAANTRAKNSSIKSNFDSLESIGEHSPSNYVSRNAANKSEFKN